MPTTRRAGKTRSLLTWLSYGIKGVAFFAMVAFLYTAGARDGARNLRVVERALGDDGEGGEDEDAAS